MTLLRILVICLYFSQSFEICQKLDRFCYCDEKCVEFEDCCAGHENFGKPGILNSILSCRIIETYTTTSVWVISKCKNENHLLSDLCMKKDIDKIFPAKSFVPVIGSNELIYENAYCAKCNNERSYQYLNITIQCPDKMRTFNEVNEVIGKYQSSCQYFVNMDQTKQRTCLRNLVRSCPQYNTMTFGNVSEECYKGSEEVVTDNSKVYRNDHCCTCWNTSCQPLKISDIIPSFSYILNFNEWNTDEPLDLKSRINSTSNINDTETHSRLIINNVIYYISYFFLCLSFISLSLLILLYSSVNVFHNFSGYLTIALSICQWLSCLFYILVSNIDMSHHWFCKYFGIIRHFTHLSLFALMGIYSLDLLQTFGVKSGNLSKKKSFKTFVIYLASTLGSVTIFISTSTVLEFSTEKNFTVKPGYGGYYCWFTNKSGALILFFLPVCILSLWNLITYIIVFYKLMKTAQECRVVQRKESNSTLWLCIRITAVFGIGYIFEILAITTNNDILIKTVAMIGLLQGFSLTLCFIWPKRVRLVVYNTLSSLTENLSKSISQNTKMTNEMNETNFTQNTKSRENLSLNDI